MINCFYRCTQCMLRITISLLALPSSCEFWKINMVLLKDIGHDVHIIFESISFKMWTSTITTCGSLSLVSSLGSRTPINRTGAFWTWLLLLFLFLVQIFILSFGLIWYTKKKVLLFGFYNANLYDLFLLMIQRLHEIC